MKIKSHDWDDDGNQLEGVATKEFYYDVSESGLNNSLFLGKSAIELEPAESLELAKWLFINSIRRQLSGGMALRDNEILDGTTRYCSDFIKDIEQANLDFNSQSILTKHYQSEAERTDSKNNIRKLATIAAINDDKIRNDLLNDSNLMDWLKDAVN